ncbi:tyrosine-type recombinase/integrase [Roseicella aerolata]|uniref:Tyrosine-type recombinase/integrase n=1 Tax=Roseicella aerolata TaxID=2883479 RepID=A0A9X1LAZ8_9PROT|nr:tyrosine-type recombinase/integrase [Roseicella aerolata]MCB4825324.1 tyrosine-type recombinase/integrase [Roseicella aerolata]
MSEAPLPVAVRAAATATTPTTVATEALAAARAYARQALAPETLRAYACDWAHFTAWCQAAGCAPLPAEPAAVAAYLAAQAPLYSRSALERRLAAIGHAHRLRALPWSAGHPVLRTTLRGIFRTHGSRRRQAAALTSAELKKLVAACGGDLAGLRDRALLLLGFAGALRRSELVAVEREHLRFTEAGLRLLIPTSKSDQEGRGVELGITRGKRPETCPVRALEAWLAGSDCRYGPVFRKIDRWGTIEHRALGGDAVRDILRKRALAARITVEGGERLSPHGLRAGFVTEAYMAGARDEQVMDHTRHRDLKTMRGYVRRAKLVTESATRLLDL